MVQWKQVAAHGEEETRRPQPLGARKRKGVSSVGGAVDNLGQAGRWVG